MDQPPVPALRPMRWWDIAPALELERELFAEDPWSAELFWSELARNSRYYLVADEPAAGGPAAGDWSGRPLAGYAGLNAGRNEAEIQTIAVRRRYWGTGTGARLLTALLDEAARRGCDTVLLEVRVDNERAQALYRRFGFTPLGVRRGYYPQSGADALVMRLTAAHD
jgi:ribosomal-protein-alanine N-acetyltransferase